MDSGWMIYTKNMLIKVLNKHADTTHQLRIKIQEMPTKIQKLFKERKMRQVKPKEKEIKIFTFDTETRGLNGEIFKLGLFGDNQIWLKNDFAEINKILRRYSLTYAVHVYIHNLDFDLSKVADYFHDEFIWQESLIIQNKPAIMTTYYYTFHDSMQLLGNASLQKICQDFNVKDGKLDLVDELIKNPIYRKYLVWEGWQKKSIIPIQQRKKMKMRKAVNIDREETKNNFFRNVPANDPLLIRYLKYDCKSLYEVIEKVIAASGLKINEFVKCPTIANMSMRIFENLFPDQTEQTHNKNFLMGETGKEAEEFCREAYHGGRTEVFIKKLAGGFLYDVTSEYPFVMREYRYPVGKFYMKKGGWVKSIWQRYCEGEDTGGIIEATVNIPDPFNDQNIPPLPFYCEKRGKLLFPTGKIRGSWTLPELKFAVDRGVQILEFHKILVFEKMSSVFIGFVNYFEKLKNDNTEYIKGSGLNKKGEPINESLRSIAKLILNALYGKFGSRRQHRTYISKKEIPSLIKRWEKNKKQAAKRKSIFRYEDELEFFQKMMNECDGNYHAALELIDLDNKTAPLKSYSKFTGENELFEYNSFSEARFIQPQIAAYITAYARMHLYKGFEKIWEQKGKIFYCDTDSIFSNKRLPENMIDSSTFGKWKEEDKNVTATFPAEKVYHMKGAKTQKTVFKGVTKKQRDKTGSEGINYLYEQQQKKELDYIPLVTEEDGQKRLNKMMTSIKRNQDFSHMENVLKGMYIRGEENKRKFTGDNSEPWKYDLESEPEIDKIIEEEEYLEEEAWICWEEVLEGWFKEKIKIPNRNTKAYAIYSKFDPKIKRKYFSSKSEHDLEWICEKAIWNVEDILLDIEEWIS